MQGQELTLKDTRVRAGSVLDRELGEIRRELPKIMSGVAELSVPLVVDVGAGPNWDKAH